MTWRPEPGSTMLETNAVGLLLINSKAVRRCAIVIRRLGQALSVYAFDGIQGDVSYIVDLPNACIVPEELQSRLPVVSQRNPHLADVTHARSRIINPLQPRYKPRTIFLNLDCRPQR
jgi:hypothetical protein